jgi:hypothetical protein
MDKPTLIILGVLISILVIGVTIKKRAFRKGYEAGEKEVTRSMLDTATWFGATSKITYNCLFLFASRYRKYGHVSSDKFRTDFLKLDHKKRIPELPIEERDFLV